MRNGRPAPAAWEPAHTSGLVITDLRIQLGATRTTGWTAVRRTRYRFRMTTRRSKYDPLATSRLTRWLVLRDLFHNVLDATELPPGTDLRNAFAAGLAALERDGWQS